MLKVLTAFFLALTLLINGCGRPASSQPITSTNQTFGNPEVRVWVNTASGVYHCPGTRWYGLTKRGEYMSQKEALNKGNRPAYGRYCR